MSSTEYEEYRYGKFTRGESEIKYRILFPENFSEEKQYPLILFLHGSGERGLENEKQLVHGSRLFVNNREDFPAIVLFPQCKPEGYWSNVNRTYTPDSTIFDYTFDKLPTEDMSMLISLLDSVIKEKFVDNERIYVGGLSMGGMGTFEILYRRPDVFTAAFIICGGGLPVYAEHYNENLSAWVFHGAKDDVVKPREVLGLVKAMKENIKEVKFTLYPEANHNSWDQAFAEKDLLPWLYSKTKLP